MGVSVSMNKKSFLVLPTLDKSKGVVLLLNNNGVVLHHNNNGELLHNNNGVVLLHNNNGVLLHNNNGVVLHHNNKEDGIKVQLLGKQFGNHVVVCCFVFFVSIC